MAILTMGHGPDQGHWIKEYKVKKGAIETVHVLPGSKLVLVVPADKKLAFAQNNCYPNT